MNELSSEAHDLLESARAGMMPDDAARARVRSAVLMRVGVAVAAGTTLTAGTTTATAAKLGSGALVKLFVSVAIVGSVGTAGYVAATGGEQPTPTPTPSLASPAESKPAPRTAPPEPAAASEPAPEPLAVVEEPARPVRRRVAKRESAAVPATTLPQQLSALRAANRRLHSGDAAAALAAVQDYDRRFPDGDLRPEIWAIRIDALCELDRTEQAGRRAERFLAQWPQSPLAERVRASCAQGGAR